jgi:hypothetical protein
MSKTIAAKFTGVGDENVEETVKYLDQIGMSLTYRGKFEDVLFSIELQLVPEIMLVLERTGYFKERPKIWEMIRLTTEGVALYVSIAVADAYVFIPKETIICIHTVSEYFLREMSGE